MVSVDALVSHLARRAVEQHASELNVELDAQKIAVALFRPSPRLRITALSAGLSGHEPFVENASFTISMGWGSLMSGAERIRSIQVSALRLNLLIDEQGGDNVSALLDAAQSSDEDEAAMPVIEHVELQNAQIEYINETLEHHGVFDLQASWDSRDVMAVATVLLNGDVNYFPVQFQGGAELAVRGGAGMAADSVSAQMQVGDLHGQLAGSGGLTSDSDDSHLELALKGHGLRELLHGLNLSNTLVDSVDLESRLDRDDEGALSSSFNLLLDSSRLDGQLRFENFERPALGRRVSGTIDAQRIDMDRLLGHSTTDARPDANGESRVDPNADRDRLLSTASLTELFSPEQLAMDVTLTVGSLIKGGFHTDDLLIRLQGDDGEHQWQVQGGEGQDEHLQAELTLSQNDAGLDGKLSVQMKRVDLAQILALADLSEESVQGRISGNAKFWFAGDSLAQIASSLDGGLFLVVEEGKLDSLMVELAGIDLMESINLVLKRDLQQTEMRCAYLDLQASSGSLQIEDFIVDTEDSIFLGEGTVDLAAEKLDLTFSTHPRDGSYFAAATPVHLRGSMASPSIRPGRRLYSRVAMAAAMASLVGPAAIVLPFIELGSGDEQSYCVSMFGG